MLIYLPAVALIFLPSFQIGVAKFVKQDFKLPEKMELGDVLALPASEDDDGTPEIAGHALAYVTGKNPFYLIPALTAPDFAINLDFEPDDERPKLKSLLPSFRFPTYPVFFQPVSVTAPAVQKTAPLFAPPEKSIFTHGEGSLHFHCWKEPAVELVGIDPLTPRHRPRLASVSSAGPGEVLSVTHESGGPLDGQLTIVVYHGAGLYTRYWGFKEAKVSKGVRVATGQVLGYLLIPANHKVLPAAPWQTLMSDAAGSPKEVKAASLLALSSRLCDSK